ncbi:MAG TPA: ABC transporter permease [Thermomicrobiales bacterium]|nr:ABC transporter permease [Thermomicrobiales bacterium]
MGADSLPTVGVGTPSERESERQPGRPIAGIVNWLFRTQEGVLLLIVVVLCVVLSRLSPVFASERNIFVLLSQMSMTAITAIGMTLLIIGREVDLSVGSMQAFVGVVAMQALNATSNLAVGLGVAILAGVIVGLVNAGLTLGLGINSFIVTLAMFSIIRGLAYTFTDAAVQNEHQLESFRAIGTGFIVELPGIGRIPWPVVITALIFALFAIVLGRTTIGRHIYAVGGNPRAAALSGVRVNGVKTLAFVITSVLAALSAFILISRMNSGQNNAGFGFELQVIGAVLLGGASLAGGQGTLIGTLLAVLLLGTLNNGIVLLGINSSWQVAVNGLVILIAVLLDARRRRALGQD